MNAAIRSELLTEPRPVDARDARIWLTDRGWSVVWIRDGRVKEPFGPTFPFAIQAAAAARIVREAHGLGR